VAVMDILSAIFHPSRWTLEEITAASTVVVAVFTTVLGCFTISLARATRKAANAADASAKAATAVEFPIIRASWMGPELLATNELVKSGPKQSPYGGSSTNGALTKFSVIPDINFRNFGRSPAFPFTIARGTAVTSRLRRRPIYSHIRRCEPNSVIEPNESLKIDIDFGFELSDDELAKIRAASAVLWFYVLLTYHDVMDRSHDVGFCWQWGKQNPEADDMSYFFDDGSAPSKYTRRT
jgi:hypothetical protein